MTPRVTHRWKRWLRIGAWGALLLGVALVLVVRFGLAERWMRGAIVDRLARITGGQVELKAFRFHFLSLRAELDHLTIHGLEPEGTPPLFHADHLRVDLKGVALLGRTIALEDVQLDRPAIHLRLDEAGRSNFPGPRTPPRTPGKPLRERIFDVTIHRLRLQDGTMLLNETRLPLLAEGGRLDFALDYHAPAAGPAAYSGDLQWERMTLVARRYLPFPSSVAARFTLTRDSFALDELRWKLPRSEFKVQARMESFAARAWTFRYQGWLALDDLRRIMRKPNAPRGNVEFLGEGTWAAGKVRAQGKYVARDVSLPYRWFHASGIESRGTYRIADGRVDVPDFRMTLLGGTTEGRVTLAFAGQTWRAETRSRGLDLAALLRAADHEGFPVTPLHWGGDVEADDVTTWVADFKHVESRGRMIWSPPARPREGEIPVSARWNYFYSMDRRALELRETTLATPTSRVALQGRLAARDSALEADLDIGDLLPWNDFIQRLRGPGAEPTRVAGRARWRGRVLGELDGPTFTGHAAGFDAAYGDLAWDALEGELTYAPDGFRLERARARRGRSTAQFDVWLALDDWKFCSACRWSFEANLERTDTDDLQGLFRTAYPARGLLTGQFRGQGTRGDPEFSGLFDLVEAQAWGFPFDRVRGRLGVRRSEISIANAEIRIGTGRITGQFAYRPQEGTLAFEAAGAALPIERIAGAGKRKLPLGGVMHFQVRGEGPLAAPRSTGSLRLVDFAVSGETLGSFQGMLRSDGRRVHVDLGSAMAAGRVEGQLDLTLAGAYPIEGDLTVERLDLDSLIKPAFRLVALTGHSSVDGRFRVTGSLLRPETIVVDAAVSAFRLDYQHLQLENVGPLALVYSRQGVRVQQAHIRGPATDFHVGGNASFTGTRALDLTLAGRVNLQLLGGFFPGLDARGAADVSATVQGTLDRPRINGRVRVEDVAANYGDFPAGLSHVTGEFLFDRSRLLFENVVAEAGGGQMVLGGSLTYGEGPLRFDLTSRATRVRVRYPEGMSWLAGGTLRLSGTPRGGVLSGNVVVERVLLSEGFDLATLIVTSRGAARPPATLSPFLRNLQLDLEATSSPDARVEWATARFESEATLRVRGTWQHPILLGNLRLLAGDMMFRGSRYRLTRGDIIFSKPFRIDPELNVEATTTIRQYEITLNFSGPASKLSLAYRSDPPLPASDIIALLALGRTGEESELRSPTRVESPEMGATTLLSEAISSQISGRVERLFGITRFKVDPFLAGTASDPNTTARVTIEQQLTRDLTITYISSVTSTQQQVVQVEYAVNREISLLFLRDQNGAFGIDVKFKNRFR